MADLNTIKFKTAGGWDHSIAQLVEEAERKSGGITINCSVLQRAAEALNAALGTRYTVNEYCSKLTQKEIDEGLVWRWATQRRIEISSGKLQVALAKTPREALRQWVRDIIIVSGEDTNA